MEFLGTAGLIADGGSSGGLVVALEFGWWQAGSAMLTRALRAPTSSLTTAVFFLPLSSSDGASMMVLGPLV